MSHPADKPAILIVDDRTEKVLALEAALEGLGPEIVRAYSGREALRFVLQREFAVILLDVNMPGMDGFETASLIRQRKHSEHVPIIFVTAFGDEMHAARGYSLGAVDYILAPVMPDVLRSKVGVFVDLYAKSAQLRSQADALRRRATQLQKLAAASLAISASPSPSKILQTLTDMARDVVGAGHAHTFFHGDLAAANASAKPLGTSSLADRLRTAHPKEQRLELLAETLMAQSCKPTRMTAEELLAHPDSDLLGKIGAPPFKGGVLSAPLLGREGTRLGMICLSDKSDGEFSGEDETLLVQLAQMASITIENTLYSHVLEANRLKDEFLATLSHELRTPLNAMLGWTELLRTEEVNEEVAYGLTVIERNIRAQSKLVEDLLDVSRITTGKLRIARRQVSLNAVADAALESVRMQAAERNVRLQLDAPLSLSVLGDADRLQQVITNLLSNAVKFTPESGQVRLALAETLGTPAMAEITVSDSGQGIDPQFLPYVFDRFRQADSSSTRRHGGLGIGLSIVRHIVELHGGTVRAASEGPGKGATFSVLLPLVGRVEAAAPVEPSRAESPAPVGLNGLSVLVVEDERDARHLIAEIIERAGAKVTAAASVVEALERIEQSNPDVIVSDIAMPDEDGYALLKKVRARGAQHHGDVPVIAVTAYARDEDRARALAAGFADHVAKPITPAWVISAISRATRPAAKVGT